MAGWRERIEDNLRQLREIRESGADDEGKQLNAEALAELDADIASLEKYIAEADKT